jgi:hypothetical protein
MAMRLLPLWCKLFASKLMFKFSGTRRWAIISPGPAHVSGTEAMPRASVDGFRRHVFGGQLQF